MNDPETPIARFAAGVQGQLHAYDRQVNAAAQAIGQWWRATAPRIGQILITLAAAAAETVNSIPPNLREAGLTKIGPLAELSRNTGVAVAWVLPADTLEQVLVAPDPLAVVTGHRDLIIEQCYELLGSKGDEDAATNVALTIVEAIDAGCWPAAQSHAANLIDSLLLSHYANTKVAVDEANLPLSPDDQLRVFMRRVSLVPLVPAYRPWYRGDPPLDGFSRHATAHAVEQPWAITPTNALVAACLAVSLTLEHHSSRPVLPEVHLPATAIAQAIELD